MKKILIFLLFLPPTSYWTIASADILNNKSEFSRPDVNEIEKVVNEFALIGFKWIDQPINKVLLIRSGSDQCAIKIISHKRFNDQKEPTVFSANEESFSGEATFVKFKDGKAHKFKVLHLSNKSPVGIGKIAYDSSQDIIQCGKARLLWRYPSAVSLLPDYKGISLSPTIDEDFHGVNFNSSNLHWYSYDESRKMQLIPISELPKAK
ncbi:MAG: hypothetical protein V4732_11425 [Pseudomonadota bacterium]